MFTGLVHLARLKKLASATILYRRGLLTVELSAAIAQSARSYQSGDGVYNRLVARDYLIAASDLVIGAVTVLPDNGDLIRETIGGDVQHYRVAPLGDEPCWSYLDPQQTVLRIHTVRVGSAA